MAKKKNNRTAKQSLAALENLKKARAAKARYRELRSEGFSSKNIDEIVKATDTINDMMYRFRTYHVENNPAVMQLMDEVGYFRSQSELQQMSKPEFFSYATSLRTFLAAPLSDENAIENMTNRLVEEIVGQNLIRKKGERRSTYMHRRSQFIEKNSDTASKAFKLFRQLENTHAGLILKGKISPDAYGSDNLIIDLFDFVETEYDGDFDKAYNFWVQKLQDQFEESQNNFKFGHTGKGMKKFDWRGGDLYGSFTQHKPKGSRQNSRSKKSRTRK